MRPLTDISNRENAKAVDLDTNIMTVRVDYVEPEPVGTIVLMPFRIVGYTKDYDGSALASLEPLYYDDDTGELLADADPVPDQFINPNVAIVATEAELVTLFKPAAPPAEVNHE